MDEENYDLSDELVFANNWWAWALKDIYYPPPGLPQI